MRYLRARLEGFTLIEVAIVAAIIVILAAIIVPNVMGCGAQTDSQAGMSALGAAGVSTATADVAVNASGMTIEQENVKGRLEEDNRIGAIKHLYVISAFSGDVIIYSSVKGKVTSGGKRLSPSSVIAGQDMEDPDAMLSTTYGMRFGKFVTTEVLGDDGTFGGSSPYIYWWDQRDVYHQHFISGGQIVHISNVPMAFPKIILNLEDVESDEQGG